MFQLTLALAAARRRQPSGMSPSAWVFLVAVLLLTVALPIALVFYVLRSRARQSDAAFVPLGFSCAWYMRGRQYDATYGGRSIHAWVLPPGRYQAASFGVVVGAAVQGPASVCTRGGPSFLRDLIGRPEVAIGSDFADRVVTADVPEKLVEICRDPALRAALHRLSRDRPVALYFKVEPGALRVDGTGSVYDTLLAEPGSIRALLDDLVLVASAAECARL